MAPCLLWAPERGVVYPKWAVQLRTIEGPYVRTPNRSRGREAQALMMGVRHFARASQASSGVRSAKERDVQQSPA